jgi:hypothetical protein
MHWNGSDRERFCKLIVGRGSKSAQPGIIPQKARDGAVTVPQGGLANCRGLDTSAIIEH